MVQGILLLVIFLFFAFLMFKQKIPTALALLFMAILMTAVAGAPLMGDNSIVKMLEAGSYGLASSILALLFGAWLGEIMNETGITKDIIRRASELGGDRPFSVAIIMTIVVAVLFTALTGLGAHIMVGMLVLPIYSAVGIKPLTASCLLIMARTTGIIFNMSQWQLYMNVTGLPVDEIKNFAAIASIAGAIVTFAFIIIELKIKKTMAWEIPSASGKIEETKKVPLVSLITPLVPFPFVIVLKWPIIPALLVGVLYGAVTTSFRDIFRILNKTIHEAVKSAAPALVLMITIGIVLQAVNNAFVKEKVLAFITPVLPGSAVSFALFFIILAPLCLYRGPLNLWGMGSGVIGLMVTAAIMPSMAVVAGFISVQLIQLSSCPTNTHNVWTADFFNLEVNALTVKIIPFMWLATAIAAVTGACIYF
jgi:Mg2+/citrate symporter